MKIVELTIDEFDDISGLDGIALVERPAHESNWLAFEHEKHYQPIYDLLDNTKMGELAFHINQLGEPMGTLEKEDYVLFAIQDAVPQEFSKELFAVPSNPNPDWEGDFNPRVRYKYVGAIRDNSRDFCKEMIKSQRVFTEEDIQALSVLNPVGPAGYSPLMWRGSYNCLHKWVKLTYVPKNELPRILNSANSRRGLISEEVGVLYDTRNDATAAAEAAGTSRGVNIGPRLGGFTAIDVIDNMPVFSTREEAEKLAEIIGCKGAHEHDLEGTIVYMPCESMEQEKMSSCDCKEGYYFDGLTCSMEPGKLSFSANDEKMEITGAAIIPNKFIIRKSAPTPMKPNGEFYYVFFTEKRIKKLAEKYMRNKLLDASNIEHTDRKADSYVKESWIVEDPIFDKSTSLGLEYPKGTWVITMKVENPQVWEKIKTGKLNGFSVEGWFNENLMFS